MLCPPVLLCEPWIWKCGFRYGEALHPGPPCNPRHIRVAVANPTALHRKEHAVAQIGADLVCLSETSAIERVQLQCARNFRQLGFQIFFGAAVPPHSVEDVPDSYMRGAAGGVAIATTLPARRSPESFPPSLYHTSRVTECFVRFGPLEVRVISVYGLPESHADSREVNNYLLAAVLQRITANAIPTLVAGDFNTAVQALPVWEQYRARGFVEAHDVVMQRLGFELPPTCRSSTFHDSMIIPGMLVDLLRGAEVLLDSYLFDAHDPLVLTFLCPSEVPLARRLMLPKPWTDFQILPDHFAKEYEARCTPVDSTLQEVLCPASLATAFTTWAQTLEAAVDASLRAQHRADPVQHVQTHLPRSHRGRCRPLRFVRRPAAQLPRKGRHGDFMPGTESTSLRLRLRVKQCRRVRTLLSGVRKAEAQGTPPDDYVQQLLNEWSAVCKASGYGRSFQEWVMAWPFVGIFPTDWPPSWWLHDLVQLVEYDCTALAAQEARLRRASFQYSVELDECDNHLRRGFAALRGPSRPPLTSVRKDLQHHAQVSGQVGTTELQLTVSELAPYRIGHPVRFAGVPGLISAVEGCQVSVALDEPISDDRGMLEQTVYLCTPPELHQEFRDYWSELWQRDSVEESQSLDNWPAFQALLRKAPPAWRTLELDTTSLKAWRKTLARTASARATGPCGFAVSELKMLPDRALEHLVRLFDLALPLGLPDFLLYGRVQVLAKTDFPTSFAQGRPITVLSCLLRLWTSLVSTQILQRWKQHLPPSIAGGVPGRAARDLTYRAQHLVEQARLQGKCVSGFTLDLVKYFNALPRPPAMAAMRHLGVPDAILGFWEKCLSGLQRFSVFDGQASTPVLSTTGVPEGDALSVSAAVAICFFYDSALQAVGLEPTLFIDNWAWQSSEPHRHPHGMRTTQDFVQSLRLTIDWKKSLAWAATARAWKWWEAHGPALMPQGVELALLPDVKDLGAAMRYRHPNRLGTLKERLFEGEARLRRLVTQPRSLTAKARLIQMSIWPACFHGAESHAIGCKRIQQLRTLASRALVGHYHATAPKLSLAVLSHCVQDPECYLLTQSLRALRRALHLHSDLASSVLEMAGQAAGTPCSAIGPATALKVLLDRNHWTLTANGRLTGPGNVRLHLTTASSQEVANAVNTAWAFHVREAVRHRNGLQQVGVPCPLSTARMLQGFSCAQQNVLARHIVGSFQSGAVRHLWSHENCQRCIWCGQVETKEHRFIQCPAFQVVRGRHPFALQVLVDHRSEWVHGPFATLPDEYDMLALIFASSLAHPGTVPESPDAVLHGWHR